MMEPTVSFLLLRLPGTEYCGLSRLHEGLFFFFFWIQGALLLQEPVITPAISITLSLSFKIAAGLHLE